MAVNTNVIYTIDEFKKAVGVSAGTLRSMRRKGLRVLSAGQKRFISGRDFQAFLDEQAKETTISVNHES